jgi:hypothetical protein
MKETVIAPSDNQRYIKSVTEAFSQQPVTYYVGMKVAIGIVNKRLLSDFVKKIILEFSVAANTDVYNVYVENDVLVASILSNAANLTFSYKDLKIVEEQTI